MSIQGILTFLVLLLVIGILTKFFPKWAGFMGESRVAEELARLEPERYRTVHDLLLPSVKPGETTQIDHVVISIFGIFVIETKNMDGWIFGKERDRFWTQSFPRKKVRFFSPILQNKGHIAALRALLGPNWNRIPIESIVVFGPRATLKVQTDTSVVLRSQLVATIRQHTRMCMNPADVERLAQALRQANITNKTSRAQHIRRVSEKKAGGARRRG